MYAICHVLINQTKREYLIKLMINGNNSSPSSYIHLKQRCNSIDLYNRWQQLKTVFIVFMFKVQISLWTLAYLEVIRTMYGLDFSAASEWHRFWDSVNLADRPTAALSTLAWPPSGKVHDLFPSGFMFVDKVFSMNVTPRFTILLEIQFVSCSYRIILNYFWSYASHPYLI